MASDEKGLDVSQRTTGKAALGNRSFGESQYLRQVGVNKLREIISGEHDEEEIDAAPKTIDRTADESSDSKPSPPEENKSQEKLHDGGDSPMTSSGSTSIPPPLPLSAGATSEAAHAPASSMNMQLWELEETRPAGAGEKRPAGDCDTSRPPSEENQVATAHGGGGPPPFSRDALTKILTARHMIDKRSLLEYSLCKGKAEHFEHLACWIRWKLGIGGLVSQLREPGVNGAPLLFQAVTTPACFEAAKKEIKNTLGVGGLTQQVRATDQQGRNLLMHAARYASSVEVFSSALELVEALTKPDVVKDLSERETGASQLRQSDMNEMNLLHHAAEGRAEEMLSEVIDVIEHLRALGGTGKKVELVHHLATGKKSGAPSPDLCALGRKWTSNVMLGEHGVDRMKIKREAARVFDEFKFAARGGDEAFKFVCQRHKQGGATDGWLRAALGLAPLSALADGEEKYTLLLAHAALGGDEAVLEKLTEALCDHGILADTLASKSDYPMNTSDFLRHVREDRSAGSLGEDMGSSTGGGDSGLKTSLFALTVLSGRTEAVDWAANFVRTAKFVRKRVGDHGQAWEALRGWPLTFAVAISDPGKGRGVFEAVCDALRKAACNECRGDVTAANKLLRQELVGDRPSQSRFSPFAVAAFSENPIVVDKVEEAYKQGARASPGGGVERDDLIQTRDVITHVGAVISMREEARAKPKSIVAGADEETDLKPAPAPEVTMLLRSCRGTGALRGLLEVMKDKDFRQSVESAELQHSLSKAKEAVKDGSFEGLRALIEKGWDCHEVLCDLIKEIGDYEESVIDIITCAIENATNPFVTAAIASNAIRRRHPPRDRNGLANLQERIDVLTAEILNKLPQTVRGVGFELAGSYLDNDRYNRRGKSIRYSPRGTSIMANLAGYIAVRWMLEPSLHEGPKVDESPSDRDTDPLEQALGRGSAASAFINSPLVLDYMELKWTCTVPSWSRRNPFDYAINEGFYTYGSKSGSSLGGTLLRILQGWDLGRPVPSLDKKKQGGEGDPPEIQDDGATLFLRGFPRTTVLPGLQFILAGVIGKPDQFFLIPFVRFLFETTSYLFMLGLYCSCVSIETAAEIPVNEVVFYLFVAGLMCREVLEFRDAMPPLEVVGEDGERVVNKSGRSQHRATSAIRGYFAKDNWNILDTASILCVLLAFMFRLMAYAKELYTEDTIFNNAFTQQAFFIARFSLAAIAPLLFNRVLSLAQVDNVLGPMTQIIWAMLFHLSRFSIFMLVVMASFALAFHSLFSHPSCTAGDDLYERYGTLHDSLLHMFEAMLGDPAFDDFEPTRNAGCTGPAWEFDAGIALLVGYMLIMSILMLNLLIAVLSTAHDAVIENAMTEFHLGRSQTIQASAHGIEKGRLPTPLNILMGFIWVGVDLYGEVYYWFGHRGSLSPDAKNDPTGNSSGVDGGGGAGGGDGTGDAAGDVGGEEAAPAFEGPGSGSKEANANNSEIGNNTGPPAVGQTQSNSENNFKPLSQQQEAVLLGGALERLLFSCTMGLVALALSAALWVVSILSLTGRIVRWMSMKAEKKRGQAEGYLRQLGTGVLGLLAFIVGLFVAALFCSFCIASSIALWFRGVYGLLEWYNTAWLNNRRDQAKMEPLSSFGKGAVMPGALGADKEVWQDAVDTVEGNNFGPTERRKEDVRSFGQDVPRRFDVGALLNMTTGWSICHLSALVSRKDKESRKEEAMLRKIDEEKRRRGRARRQEEANYRDEARKSTLLS